MLTEQREFKDALKETKGHNPELQGTNRMMKMEDVKMSVTRCVVVALASVLRQRQGRGEQC